METTLGLATYVPVTFISVGPDEYDGVYGFANEITWLLDQSTLPTVLTTSYAFDESLMSASMAKSVFCF